MVAEAKEVGQQRYRESYGRYLEDFPVGDVYEHRPGRSITETDNTWFTLLTMNQHPLHFDREYGAKTEFGQVLVNSCLTISLVTGMSVSDISQKTIAILVGIRFDSLVRYLLAILFTPSPPCWPS